MYSRRFAILSLLLILCSIVPASFVYAGGGTGMTPEQMEEAGIDNPSVLAGVHRNVSFMALAPPTGKVLLIPDSTTDVVAMFDPYDGHYLGDLIIGTGTFTTPINAILGPDGNIYVSDQSKNTVFVFDTAGTYLSAYADSTDGISNIRGIAFRGNNLFVTSINYVAEFAGPHNRLADFITSGGFWDIMFLTDGSCVTTNSSTNLIRHRDPAGVVLKDILSVQYPEQVCFDSLLPGDFLEAGFTEKSIKDFDIAGVITQTTPLSNNGRGVYRLGDGNLLASGYVGVQVLSPGTGAVISQVRTGTSWRFIEEVDLSAWTDLGHSLPGLLGSPVLTGDGALKGGSTVTVTLSNVAVSTFAHLIVGVTNASLPFSGGVLVPYPNIIIAIPTGPAGLITIPANYPPGIAPGLPVFLQYWIQDPTGPLGLTASNAITAITE